VDKSLLKQITEANAEPRFFLLETIREYARERLRESGGMADVERAHAAYYLILSEEIASTDPEIRSTLLGRLEVEHENIRAATRSMIAAGNTEWAQRLGTAQVWFWEEQEYFNEGRDVLGAILGMPGMQARTASRARAAYSAGTMDYRLQDFGAACKRAWEALDIFREVNDRRGMAAVMLGIAPPLQRLNRCAEARALLQEAVAIWDDLGEETAKDYALGNLASIARLEQDYETARTILEPLVEKFRARGDLRAAATSLSGLGDVAAALNNPPLALVHYQQALELFRKLEDPAGVGRVLRDLGNLSRECNDPEAARDYYLEALRECAKVGRRSSIARVLASMSRCAARHSQPRRALKLAAAAAELWRTVDPGIEADERQFIQQVFEQTRTAMEPREHSRLWAEGQSMTVEELIQYASGEAD
jgi:tetratricopeptide (TPR) repeat protein